MDPELIPAATLILFRECGSTAEHLFVERAATMKFAGGATVFPGGRIDTADHDFAARFSHIEPADAAARIAAIRETLEEAGLLVGTRSAARHEHLAAMRTALHHGETLSATLDAHNIELALDELVPFARWCPKHRETRNFDTRFYITQMSDVAAEASADEAETTHLFWATAQHVLDEANASRLKIIFPTRRNLERLAALARFERAKEQAELIAPEAITPQFEDINGVPHLTIPTDRGYPVTREALASAMRG